MKWVYGFMCIPVMGLKGWLSFVKRHAYDINSMHVQMTTTPLNPLIILLTNLCIFRCISPI